MVARSLNKTSSQQTFKASSVEKTDDLEYDIGHLMCLDVHPIETPSQDQLLNSARDNVQLLVNRLFQIENITHEETGLYAELPDPEFRLPRGKPCPKKREMTRFEKYQQEKGLRVRGKNERDALVYDEVHDEFRPRFGWKKANNAAENDIIIPAKAGDEKFEDPFLQRQLEKKEKKRLQLKNQVTNIGKGAAKKGSNDAEKENRALAMKNKYNPTAPSSLKISNVNGGKINPKRAHLGMKDDFLNAYDFARVSTASMGKFDTQVKDEKSMPVKKGISHLVASGSKSKDEKTKAMKISSRILKENSKKKTGQLKTNAINIFQHLTEKDTRKTKKVHLMAQAKGHYKVKGSKAPRKDSKDFQIAKKKK
ncbi:ribosome biogenesis regulatory protein [Naegleria gruberi]|uniref:Ribosome biogenesis regulatory protein n=1 Tax=Naegleria gruberi TaxID=5762 RepID=D2V6H6_NAEGR|nr:ribosome biogenesis regulatory protein [Naegleria gruberi]EFC47573.1 ribosome biogenesis regulatory protein [Naegleria gruberi]|eukprot:XP_002680317.1 ribosome biogenesis regulatory protein [Naegleria gruberi strain NEG-M]